MREWNLLMRIAMYMENTPEESENNEIESLYITERKYSNIIKFFL